MSYIISISNAPIDIIESTLNLGDRVNERSTCTFTAIDDTGTNHYYKGEKIVIVDGAGNVFKGTIDVSDEYKPSSNNDTLQYDISCVDMHWCADKRIAIKSYVGMYAGDIFADLINSYLAPEGVQAQIAYDRDTTSTDFSTGTLSGTVATSDGDGSLQIAKAGSNLDVLETTTTDFGNGTLTNVAAANNALTLTNQYGIKVYGKVNSTNGNLYFYWKIWGGTRTIASGDKLVYDIWMPSTNPLARGGIDGSCSDGTTLRDYNSQSLKDQNGLASHPNTDLSGYTDQWYNRVIDLTPLAGKVLNNVTVSQEGDNIGAYTFYVKKVYIKDNSNAIAVTLFDAATMNTSSQTSNNGYSNIAVSVATVYLQNGTRISPTTSLTSVGLVQDGYVICNKSIPTNTYVNVSTSIDGGATWSLLAAQNSIISGILAGLNVSGKTIQTKLELGFTGTNPTITPTVNDVTVHVDTAYTATKSDYLKTWDTQTDFNTGTTSNVTNDATGKVILTGAYRSWDDGIITSQTLIGSNTPTQAGSVVTKVFTLGSATGGDAKSRFDFAGTWSNFTCSMDMFTPPASTNINPGICYLTTGTWLSGDTFAYFAGINSTAIFIRRGTNGGASSSTVIANISHNIPANTQVTMRVIVNSTTHVHQVYIDDVLYCNVTDSTFTTAGYVGVRINNGSGVTQTTNFDNFAIVASTTGTWTSSSQTVSTVGTCDSSLVLWDETIQGGSSDLIEISLDNGLTWNTATNGAAVPGLTKGTSMSGKTLKVRSTLSCTNPNLQPSLNGLSIFIASSYNATGYRISPFLDLTPVGRAGYSNIDWTVTLPTSTSLLVETSIDGGATYQTATDNNVIPSLSLQPLPYVDYASSDASTNYTITGSWVYDINNKLINATSTSLLKYNAFTTYDSCFVEFDIYGADGVGAFINATDINNMYYALIRDNLSATGTPGTATIYKVVSGIWSQLATCTINCDRLQGHRFRFIKDGTAITLNFDGTTILTYTDSGTLLAANKAGLYNLDGNASIGSLRIQPLGTYCPGKSLLVRTTLSSTDANNTPTLSDIAISVKSDKIEPGPIINEATFNYVPVSDCLQSLSEQANKWYNIDADGIPWFKDRYTEPAPFIATGYNIQPGIRVKSSNPQYRNKEYVVGGKDTTDVQYKSITTFSGSKTFPLNFPLAKVPTVKVNGIAKTVGIKGVDTGKDFYWSENDVVLYQDDNGTQLNDSIDKLEIWYQGYFDTIVIVPNFAEISERQQVEIDGTGIVEYVDTATNLVTLAGSYQLANSKLEIYGSIGRTATFRTDKPGLKPGHILTMSIPEHDLINDQFIIESVTVTDEQSYLWYDVVATDGPLTNSWARAFAKMVPVATVDKINLGQGNIVSVPVTFSDTTTWSENTTVTVYACPVCSNTTFCSSTLYVC